MPVSSCEKKIFGNGGYMKAYGLFRHFLPVLFKNP